MEKQILFFQNQSKKSSKKPKGLSKLAVTFGFFLFLTTLSFGQTIVDCAAGPVNTTYCYVNSDTTQFVFTNTDGFPLNVYFNAGQVEANFDELIVLDSDGVTNLNAATPYGNNGDLTGITYQSSGDTITIQIDSDNVISCETNAFTPWDFDIWCQTCINPTVTYDTSDCTLGDNYSIFVDISDMGSATSLNINDDQGSPEQSIANPGIVTFGPYPIEIEVIIIVSNPDDINCVLTSDTITCLGGFITIDESYTTQELVEDILFGSGCVELSNFSQSTGTDFGDVNGIAAFDSNGASFPFQEGIVLSSGNVQNAPGPNETIHGDGGFDWPGDADLEANTTATDTNNASFIQFDFVPLVDQISFNFLLASEEYNQNFECTYSDAFAFILTDTDTGVVQNLAVLPGTNIPIEVTNIRPDVPGQCSAVNEEYFDKYNFAPFNPESEAAIDFNGQIVSLQAIGEVILGNLYTIKLVLADETDTAYDSAVFIEAGSFDIGNVDLGNDILIENGTAQCNYIDITLDAGDTEDATYQWFKDDIELVGETNNTLLVTEEGLYRVDVQFLQAPDCVASDEIIVEMLASPIFDLGEDLIVCGEDTTILDATVSNPDDLTNISYTWFKDGIEITGETNSTLIIIENGLYSVEVAGNECITTDEINVQLTSFTVSLGEDISLCEVESYTITAIIEGEDESNAAYLWSTGETTSSITVSDPDVYSVEVTINDCMLTESVIIDLGVIPIIELGEDFNTCFETEDLLDASPSNMDPEDASYQWSLDGNVIAGEISVTLSISQFGTYGVIVTSGICVSEDTIIINSSNELGVELGNDFTTCFNTPVFLDASPSIGDPNNATFEWSLDGVLLSDTTATLDATEHGNYSVTVNLFGCSDTDSIALTPLGDLGVDLGGNIETCFDEQLILDATPSLGDPADTTYLWSFDGVEFADETSSTLNATQYGVYSVVVSIGECSDEDSMTTTGRDDLFVSLGNNVQTCPDMSVTLAAITDEEGVSYQWSLDDTVMENQTSATLEASEVGTYTVTIRTGECTGSSSVEVYYYDNENCVISQGLSPHNYDGYNDYLDLSFLDDRSGISNFQVFNRLGAVVYNRDSYRKEWTGQSNADKILPTGTYYYVIDFDSEDPVYGNQATGWVYVNREEN